MGRAPPYKSFAPNNDRALEEVAHLCWRCHLNKHNKQQEEGEAGEEEEAGEVEKAGEVGEEGEQHRGRKLQFHFPFDFSASLFTFVFAFVFVSSIPFPFSFPFPFAFAFAFPFSCHSHVIPKRRLFSCRIVYRRRKQSTCKRNRLYVFKCISSCVCVCVCVSHCQCCASTLHMAI